MSTPDEISVLGNPELREADSARAEAVPAIQADLTVPTVLGIGALVAFAAKGGDVEKVFQFYSDEVRAFPDNGANRLDLALLHVLREERAEAYCLQAKALKRQQLFRVVGTEGREIPVRRRVLALVAPGDFMNNAQIEFLLDGCDIGLDILYVCPDRPLPVTLPEHDVLFCAVNESDENGPVLQRLGRLLPDWPRPVLNAPGKIKQLTRDGIPSLFAGSPDICAPSVRRIARGDLGALAANEVSVESVLPGAPFPLLVRPVGSHCGQNFEKIDHASRLVDYLNELAPGASDFFLSAFHDYRSADGLFRKYRIVLIDGRPHLCHLAISDQWKIHYVTVGMAEDAGKRAEEARVMETFDRDFALRHANAFAELTTRLGLDYFGIDCAELPDGRLLLFEAETAMVIHAMDSPDLYPYKRDRMERVFAAFRALIDRASARGPGIAEK